MRPEWITIIGNALILLCVIGFLSWETRKVQKIKKHYEKRRETFDTEIAEIMERNK